MSKLLPTLLFSSLLVFSGLVQAREVSGIEVPETVSVDGQELVLNGAGVRDKWFMDVYVGALYLPRPMSDPQEIIETDAPMAIRLVIVSGMINSERLREATMEGFEKGAGDRLDEIRDEVEHFLSGFDEEIAEGDYFDITYLPGQGVRVSKNGQDQEILARGLLFKRAVFGIWLADDPVQSSLKERMLDR